MGKWAVLREKVPNVLSRRPTKTRMDFFWYDTDLKKKKKKKIQRKKLKKKTQKKIK